jgi:hypothetical protein
LAGAGVMARRMAARERGEELKQTLFIKKNEIP